MTYWMYDRKNAKCKMCGESLRYKRSDAKYCSTNCRKKASRWAAKLNQDASDIAYRIRGVQEYLDDDEQKSRAAEVLQELRNQIEIMLGVASQRGTDRPGAANRDTGERHT